MLLSDVLGKPATCDGVQVGYVIDARFVLRGKVEGSLAEAELLGLVVGPRKGAAFLGYERVAVDKPALLNTLFARRQKGAFLVTWDEVDSVGDVVELRDDFTRWSSRLR